MAGARTGLALFKRALPPGIKRLRWSEFGADSFGAYEPGATPSASWRVGNAVLLGKAYCSVECEFDVVPVTRAYSRTLNANARRSP